MSLQRRKIRTQSGLYLVECLVGMILGALLCFTLLQMLTQTMRVTSTNANQQNAALIAQTVLDSVKARDFSSLKTGTYPLKVNSLNSGELSNDVDGHQLPVGINVGWLTWSSKSTENAKRFTPSVVLTIQEGVGDPTTLSAVVSVSWSDSQTQVTKTVATTTTLHSKGVNFWP